MLRKRAHVLPCAMHRRNAWQFIQACLRGLLASLVKSFCFQEAPLTAQATQASAAPSYHVLQYKYVPDILEKRGPFREKHLALAGQKVNEWSLNLFLLVPVLACALWHANISAVFCRWRLCDSAER